MRCRPLGIANPMVRAASCPPLRQAQGRLLQKTRGRGTHSFNTGKKRVERWATRQPYELGTYGELTSRSPVGDGLTIDHQPSNASNIARAEGELGRALTPEERKSVRDQGTAVAVPEDSHRSASPTYGGRNTPGQIQADAANPQAAAARDSNAMVNAASSANKAAAQAAADKIQDDQQ